MRGCSAVGHEDTFVRKNIFTEQAMPGCSLIKSANKWGKTKGQYNSDYVQQWPVVRRVSSNAVWDT